MITPILIVDGQRSGIIWLTSLLASHPNGYVPQHTDHYGQYESEFFRSGIKHCNFCRTETDRCVIQCILECSDFWYFLLPDNAPRLDIRELVSVLYLVAAVNVTTRQRGATAWVEKSPAYTFVLHRLIAAYPEAKFIHMERNLVGTVRSIVHKHWNSHNPLHWTEAVARTTILHRLGSSSPAVYLVKYDDLVQNTDATLEKLLGWLGIDGDIVSDDRWGANSSFTGVRPTVQWQMRSMTLFTGFLVGLIPSLVWRACVDPWFAFRARRAGLPRWFFRVFGAASGANYDS